MIVKSKILLIFLSIILTLLVGSFHHKENKNKDYVPKSAYLVKKISVGCLYNG